MNKETGGPAFPHVADIVQMQGDSAIVKSFTQNGMTLRDYFAAHAPEPYKEWRGGSRGLMDIVEWRWFYADQMLKAREQ